MPEQALEPRLPLRPCSDVYCLLQEITSAKRFFYSSPQAFSIQEAPQILSITGADSSMAFSFSPGSPQAKAEAGQS